MKHGVMRNRVSGFPMATAMVLALSLGLTACGSPDSGTGPSSPEGSAYIRYVNGMYKEVAVGPTTATVTVSGTNTTTVQTTTVTYEPVSIDILIDSGTTAPSTIGLAPATRSAGPAGQAPANLVSGGYTPVGRGVRSFVARRSGLTPVPGYSFFTTEAKSGPQEHLIRQYLTAKTYYTLGLAGTAVMPQPTGEQVMNPPKNVIFNLATDNPFPPPSVTVNGTIEYMARFQVYNFATWGGPNLGPTQWDVYLTPGGTPPQSYDVLSRSGTALSYKDSTNYRRYINAKAGTYYLTLRVFSGGWVNLMGTPVTLKPGEVHSFIVVNDMPTFTVTNRRSTRVNGAGAVTSDAMSVITPTPPTFKVFDVIDNQY